MSPSADRSWPFLAPETRKKCGTGIDLRWQRRSRGKQRVRISVALATLQRAGDQAHVKTRRACFVNEGHGLVVRAHAAGHPAITESCGIEERPQIRFAIFRFEDFSGRETSRAVCPVRKWRVTQVTL